MSKKSVLFLSLSLLFSATTVSALIATPPGQLKDKRVEIREEIKDKIQEKVQNFKNTRASLKQATLTFKSDTTLTVEKDGVTYPINITSQTRFRRRFWGKSSLSEMYLGDLLDIQGKWADDTKTIINANIVRDTSIQMRFGVFFGTVTSVSDNTIVMQSAKRDTQTVTTSSTTKFINRRQQTINSTDILIDHKIRVKGLWNNLTNTITEVKEIKDFTLPIVKTSTAPETSATTTSTTTPTETPTPSPTSTPPEN